LIAIDSHSKKPLSSMTGIWPFGFIARCAGVRVSPVAKSTLMCS